LNQFRTIAPLVCLIGYRGTGKSTVSQLLSARIGWPCLDADIELERRAGKSIRDIFAKDGEMAFRDLETAILQELTNQDRLILALGGGAVLREENRLSIRRGLVVWLQADPPTIWERMRADPLTTGQRPNLTTGGLKEIEELLAARTPLYEDCADYTVQTAGRAPDQIADEIVCLLQTHFPSC
jgi:shikimate kinase